MMVALLHSNRQLRTERYEDTEKGCQKPAVQQKTTDDNNDQQINCSLFITEFQRICAPKLQDYPNPNPISLTHN